MARAERLLALLELLRVHRYPVPGAALAQRLGVSVRTLYRDIAVLQDMGARIAGEAGVGYVLRPGFTLPPLTFTDDELDALLLGARWVTDRGDAPLAEAARRAVAKIRAVLPSDRRALPTTSRCSSVLEDAAATPLTSEIAVHRSRFLHSTVPSMGPSSAPPFAGRGSWC